LQSSSLYKEYATITLKHVLEEGISYDLLLTFNPVFASTKGKISLTKIFSKFLKNCYRMIIGNLFESLKLNIYFTKVIKSPLTLGGPYLVERFARERSLTPVRIAKVQILLPRGLDIDYKFIEDPEVENKIDVFGAHCEFDKVLIRKFSNKPIYKIGFYETFKQHVDKYDNYLEKDTSTHSKKIILYSPHNISEMENLRVWINKLIPLLNNFIIFIKLHPEVGPNNEKRFDYLSVRLQALGFKILDSHDLNLYEKLRSEADLLMVDGGNSVFYALRSGKLFMVLKPLLHFENRNLPDLILNAIPTLDYFNFDPNQIYRFISTSSSLIDFDIKTSSLRKFYNLDFEGDLTLWGKVNDYILDKIDKSFL
jgi:hypothetical protein